MGFDVGLRVFTKSLNYSFTFYNGLFIGVFILLIFLLITTSQKIECCTVTVEIIIPY